MEFLPRSLGTRPRLACEVRAEGVVAARAEDASAVLSAVSRVPLGDGVVIPQLRVVDAPGAAAAAAAAPGTKADPVTSVAGRVAIVAAVRKALEAVSQKTRDVTLVVPDAAVRVLLLDFDELPDKAAEALPVVRFRLKKLLPFDADDAAVSYQVMSSSRSGLQVMAVAMPREVLAEYESVVREAGFEPGAILPSTLAALSGLEEGERPMLVVNAGREGVTTAIVRGGVLLLHRSVDLGMHGEASVAEVKEEPVRDHPADTSISAIAARMAAANTQLPPVEPTPVVESKPADIQASDVAQAVSVAMAYYEDTLETAPAVVFSAGTLGAPTLTALLDQAYVSPVAVQEMVDRQSLAPGASTAGSPSGIPLGWLAGVRGALAN